MISFLMFNNSILKNKTDVKKCSAKVLIFETSVHVNNISENNIMCYLKNSSVLKPTISHQNLEYYT